MESSGYPTCIILIGARGSGKSTLARTLARRLGVRYVDTDDVITAHAGQPVSAIVTAEGWSGFREREHQALVSILLSRSAVDSPTATVIATGGGMILDPRNRDLLRAHGTVFYLKATAHCLRARLKPAGTSPTADESRPSLTGGDMLSEIEQVLAEREQLYQACAHFCLDASCSPEDLTEQITAYMSASGDREK